MTAKYNLATCLDASSRGHIDDWVDGYLTGGPWANEGLRAGLKLHHRFWLGPLFVPLNQLKRCCGPESSAEFRVPSDAWNAEVSTIAQSLSEPADVPPLLVEWRSGELSIRDGNHRAAAMLAAGWTHCWIFVWCNSASDYDLARSKIDMRRALPIANVLSDHLARDGWVRLPGAVDASLIGVAQDAINMDFERNFDPKRQVEYDNINYCPGLRTEPPIMDLMTKSLAVHYLNDWLGEGNYDHDPGQIAIRRTFGSASPENPEWHIDGVGTDKNGLPSGTPISNFTALVGVFLSLVTDEFAGNFTVWPGSHTLLQSYFRNRGENAMIEGKPRIDPGTPIQLVATPGDLVICHYQLAHAAAMNVSADDRIAVYFRVWFKDIDDRRWELLTNIWNGWNV